MKNLKLTQLPSLTLALLLQFAPVCKLMQSTPMVASAPMAIVLKLVAATVTVLGAVHAVSGASAVLITSATNSIGTNGVSYSYRITENSPSQDSGVWYNATPLPPGLTINTNTGQITGVPTQIGVTLVHLTAGYLPEHLLAIPTNMTLTIRGKPVITAQPANQTASVGGNATFAVTATGLPLPAYRWRFNGNVLADQTNATLNLTNVSAGQSGPYSVVLSNLVGSVTSVVATLTVNSLTPVGISSPPQNKTVLIGSPASFSVTATGSTPITYQWQKDTVPINGATNSTLLLPAVAASAAGQYAVQVSNAANSITSAPATLAVVPAPEFHIYEQQGGQFVAGFSNAPGAAYEILYADAVDGPVWLALTNFPPQPSSGQWTVSDSLTNNATRFYRIRVSVP